jgi:hypothetical protein
MGLFFQLSNFYSCFCFLLLSLIGFSGSLFAQKPPSPISLHIDNPLSFSVVSDIAVNRDSGSHSINVLQITSTSSSPQLQLTATSSEDSIIIRNIVVTYQSANSTGSITYETVPGAEGVAWLVIKLKDVSNLGSELAKVVRITVGNPPAPSSAVIVYPSNNQVFDYPAVVLVGVSVYPASGRTIVPPVNLIDNGTVVGSDYTVGGTGHDWLIRYLNSPPIGTRIITAEATDSLGNKILSSPISIVVRQAPQLTTPVFSLPDGNRYVYPTFIRLRAEVSVINNSPPSLEFQINNVPINPPLGFINSGGNTYQETWLNPTVGTHALRVKASYPNGTVLFSNEIVATVEPTPPIPGPPVGLTANVLSRNQIELAWTGTLNGTQDKVDWFNLYISSTSIDGPYTFNARFSGFSTWLVGSLNPATKYYFKLTSENRAAGESVGAFTSATTLP